MLRIMIICSIIAISVSAYGDLELKPVHPDESAHYTYNERFSSMRSLESLTTLKSALDSFRKLTETAAGKIPRETLGQIGNTSWEMQHLGFVNHVRTLKGTILKQEYLIKKLRYELAQIKSKLGEINQRDLLQIKREYEKAEGQFQEFWDTFGIAD